MPLHWSSLPVTRGVPIRNVVYPLMEVGRPKFTCANPNSRPCKTLPTRLLCRLTEAFWTHTMFIVKRKLLRCGYHLGNDIGELLLQPQPKR